LIIVLDTKCLVRWASTDDPGNLDRARLDHLLATVAKARGRIVLPTPVIAEFLVRTDDATADWLVALEKKAAIVVQPFDRKAALECALIDRTAIAKGDKRGGRTDTYQRIKVDRQIVAIARAVSAHTLVTDDAGMTTSAHAVGLRVLSMADLETPDAARQQHLDLPHV
jgi:predicted nucleic acid-binding protein